MEVLALQSIFKYFGGVCALKEINFCANMGERIAIIGPNGAGKTTLFNVLDGQIQADKGQVFFFGNRINDLPTYKRTSLGIVRSFQLISLFPNLSIFKNILLALHGVLPSRYSTLRSINSFKTLNIRAQELLEEMDLWDKRDELVESISYGEKRKLEIALCLATKPKLLLLDEPNAGLSADESSDVCKHIRTFQGDVTVIVIAHDIDMVFDIAQRIIVLHLGEIVADGTCAEIAHSSLVRDIYFGNEDSNGSTRH